MGFLRGSPVARTTCHSQGQLVQWRGQNILGPRSSDRKRSSVSISVKGTAQSSRRVQPTVGSAKILSIEDKNSRQFSLKKRPSPSPSRRQLRARGKVDGQRSRLSRDQTAAWGTGCAAVHVEGRHAWKKS